jgi:prefoldin subunit 5
MKMGDTEELVQARESLAAAEQELEAFRPEHDALEQEVQAIQTAKAEAMAAFKEQMNEVGERFVPASGKLAQLEGEVRRRRQTIEALAGNGELPGPDQGVGGEV